MTPQHRQLEDQVLKAIRDGLLLPGDALPPERELSMALGISRMTLRYALNKLKAQGHLESQVGKGWRVSPAKIEQTLVQLTGLSSDMHARGLTVKSKVLEFRKVIASSKQAEGLGMLGEPVYLLQRLRSVSGEPLALEKVHVAERICPGLDRFDFASDSLYRVMQQEYGLTLARAVQVVEASLPDANEAALLQIDPRSPVLRSERTVYTSDNQLVEFGTAGYRGDRYKYQLHLQGSAQGMSIV
jgi:GntR family transcriptional regulator